MSDRALWLAIWGIGAVFVIGLVLLIIFGNEHGRERCAKIGAEYHAGRDFSVCIKPDGSMWRLP